VKIWHVAALSLVLAGWCLMMPPFVKGKRGVMDGDAPLAKWTVTNAFDTAAECENFRGTSMIFDQKRSAQDLNNQSYKVLHAQSALSKCIAGDDPRLVNDRLYGAKTRPGSDEPSTRRRARAYLAWVVSGKSAFRLAAIILVFAGSPLALAHEVPTPAPALEPPGQPRSIQPPETPAGKTMRQLRRERDPLSGGAAVMAPSPLMQGEIAGHPQVPPMSDGIEKPKP
jgi:hypothetical protein